jgi:dUTPase
MSNLNKTTSKQKAQSKQKQSVSTTLLAKPSKTKSLSKKTPKEPNVKKATVKKTGKKASQKLALENSNPVTERDGFLYVKTKIALADKEDRWLPRYKDEKAACVELIAKMPQVVVGGVTMPPKVLLNHRASYKVQTGIRIALPPGFKVCVAILDELAEKGLVVSNAPAQVVGEEVVVQVINVGRELVEIKDGDKIALAWVEPTYRFDWELVDSVN